MSELIDVHELLDKLAKSYLEELPRRLSDIESIVLSTESGSEFADEFENLYRQVHSMKGTAGTYGFHIITAICHKFEDALSVTQGDKTLFCATGANHWLKYIDLLRTAVNELENNNSNFSAIEQDLATLINHQVSHSQPTINCLIVSNSQLYENLFATAFSHTPIMLSFCTDGHEALGRLLNEKFDLLITEMETPSLNGIALTGALRLSNNRNNKITTVLLTSTASFKNSRNIDPDYIIVKDNQFIDNLTETIQQIIQQVND